ncbi:MAG TPA: cobyrinate a,c-diamide synthase [Desulfotomaculum sp.]|nr:cobyrinate a,c-diamide synthase [Desulfotomaculum sp.]
MDLRRLVIAGTASGVGKTTVAVGLMGALAAKGLIVQGFKAGPDYIDPGFHTAAAGRPSRNLDPWMLPADTVREVFLRGCRGADIAIIEGVMGLYDGLGPEGEGSTARLAKLLDAPVILVVDVRGMSASAAAVVLGFKTLDPTVNLAGVILTFAGSARHAALVREAVEEKTGVPVLGALKRDLTLCLPERHLGLVPVYETAGLPERIGLIATAFAEATDLDALLRVADAPPVPGPGRAVFPAHPLPPRVRIAVARDAAFSFYYPENLELLAAFGAELAFFSPLKEITLPPGTAGLYLGGGFPEVFAKQLAANVPLRHAVKGAIAGGMPVIAECGGLLYLCEEIEYNGTAYPLAGVLPARAVLTGRLQRLGYAEAEAVEESCLCRRGEMIRGHVFHYSRLNWRRPRPPAAYRLRFNSGAVQEDGAVLGNLTAAYLHLHFLSRPETAARFVDFCRGYAERVD